MTQNPNDTNQQSILKKITQGTVMAIIALTVGVFLTDPVQVALFPPEPDIRIVSLSAENGKVSGQFPNYVYSPRSYSADGILDEFLNLTIINDGDGNANNFKISFNKIPKSNWLDYHDTIVVNSNLPEDCPSKTSECNFELISRQIGPIQLKYRITFDFEEIKISNSESIIKIVFLYDEIHHEQVISIKVQTN